MKNLLKVFIGICAVSTPALYISDYFDAKTTMQWYVPLVLDGWIMLAGYLMARDKGAEQRVREGKIKNRVGLWLWKE